MISILLVDDHDMVRSGFRRLLETHPHFHVAGEATNGEEAYRHYFDLRPDVILLDLLMPGEGGLATLRRLTNRDAAARVLVLSVFDEPGIVRRALENGASGYLSKGASEAELVEGVETVAAGHTYIESRLSAYADSPASPIDVLTTREFEIFTMLAQGRSVNEISEVLHLSPKTVGAHRTSIMKKMSLHNSAELARLAIVWNVVRVPSQVVFTADYI